MPNAALDAYLAKNYLDGAKAEAMLARNGQGGMEKKKRRKKRVEGQEDAEGSRTGSGLRVVDAGDQGWKEQPGGSDEEAVVVLNEEEEERKKKKKWSKVGASGVEEAEVEEAADERPQMADEDGLGMDSSMQTQVERRLHEQQREQKTKAKPAVRAGLKTREEMRAERLERERLAASQPSATSSKDKAEEHDALRHKREREEKEQETVYRDASGRKIDIRKDDEERKRVKEEERRREREKKDWNKGQVQLEKAREAQRREEEERHTSFARYSTDEGMNSQLREMQRASDPALGFLTKKQTSKGPQKPAYKGSFPPNRFSIRPGYRWDGVERSNGFESKFFQKKHERGRRREEMDAWGKEDM